LSGRNILKSHPIPLKEPTFGEKCKEWMLPEELWETEVIKNRWDMPVAQEEKQYEE